MELNNQSRDNEYDCLLEKNKWSNFFSSNRNYFAIKKSLFIVTDTYILSKYALILDSGKRLVSSLLHESFYWVPKFLQHEIIADPIVLEEELKQRTSHFNDIVEKVFEGEPEILELDSAIFLLHPFGWYAFGHLNDTLLRLKALDGISLDESIPFLVSNPKRIIGFEEHLKIILGFTPQIIEIPRRAKIIRVKNLIVPVSSSVYTSFTKEDYIWMREKYLTHFNPIVKKNGYLLYLSRNHVSPGKRSVVNEAEVLKLLNEHDFIILTGNEPLSEIVNYFYNADLVVGYHGSLFANLFYSRAECKVLEFCAKNREDHSFEKKFKLVKEYQHILVNADDNFNAEIDIAFLKNYLANYPKIN